MAGKDLEKATKFNFRFVQAFTTLANAYLLNGEVEKSIKTNIKALEISPEFAIAHNNLAISYLENNQPELAIEHADKAKKFGYEVALEIRNEFAYFVVQSTFLYGIKKRSLKSINRYPQHDGTIFKVHIT